jgi:capsid protein
MDWRETGIDFWSQPAAPEITAGIVTPPPAQVGPWAGDKFHGGFGSTQLYDLDYWTLRERSAQLFRDNLYARGLLRRMVTNEINVGLALEAKPEEAILGVADDSLADWSEEVETRFALYGNNPNLCDFFGQRTLGALQRQIRLEALISGDVLVVLDVDRVTGLPKVRLVNANKVRTPIDTTGLPKTHTIEHGVELDSKGRHVAYWVDQRVLARGRRSGRRVAWLVYGTERRMDDVRGEPLLALVLQSLKEIDRYRDSALRKAVINSILAMFIQKDADKPGTLPMLGGATRRDQVTPTDSVDTDRTFDITKHIPGLFMQELQTGEKPVPHSTAGTDVNFGPFEESIVQAIAWANEVPPEILRLSFGVQDLLE